MNIVKLFITCVLFIFFDLIWFSFSLSRIYNPSVISIQNKPINMRLSGGIFAWMLLAFGINYFVLTSQNHQQDDMLSLFTKGALFGLIVYGVYNGTMYAIFSDYDLNTFMYDLLWGIFVSGLVTTCVSYIHV